MKKETGKRISAMNAVLAAAISVFSVAVIAVPSAKAGSHMNPAEQCDAEAGSENDLERNMSFAPVATQDLRIGIALSACREAYNQVGGPRQIFQLARVLHAAGQKAQAFQMLQKASDAGHAAAMVNYAVMLGERGDQEREFALYQKAAAKGNIVAAYNLGVAYRDGTGTQADGALAVQWFERASAAKDNLGAFNLAVMLDEGTQVAEDNEKAARFYRLAADLGNVDAMINLALMLESGEGVKRDPAAARALYERAAEKGDDFALLKIAQPAMDTAATAAMAPGEEANLVLSNTRQIK